MIPARQLIKQLGAFRSVKAVSYSQIGFSGAGKAVKVSVPQLVIIFVKTERAYQKQGIQNYINQWPRPLAAQTASLTALLFAGAEGICLVVQKQPILHFFCSLYFLSSKGIILKQGSGLNSPSSQVGSDRTFMTRARSQLLFARGPITQGIPLSPPKMFQIQVWPQKGIRSADAFSPNTPQNQLGTLMLPPMSDPSPNGEHLELINPPSPPELPPVVLFTFHGFWALPQSLLGASIVIPD